jgi:hypothetical protein
LGSGAVLLKPALRAFPCTNTFPHFYFC